MAECLPFSTYKQLPFAPSKPSSALTHINSEQKLKTYVEKENHIFISGHGGDHIFSCPPSISVGADSFLEEGLFRSIKIMNELSDYFRMPIYKIYGENIFRLFKYVLKIKGKTIQDAHLKKRSIDWKTKKFNDLIKNSNKLSVFKNLDKLDYIPGKLDDLEGIYSLFSMMDICVRDFQNPIFYPLSYTPIVEIAFGIPTYKMFQKGYDRFPLRKEVYKKYNTNNMWRRDKGETTGIMQLGFKSNLKEIKELCIEGNFSRNGLIDKDLLLNEIESYAAGESLNMWPVIQILSAEIFMKYW
jgi:asparagine synthase (glutamine-hydrolysing)